MGCASTLAEAAVRFGRLFLLRPLGVAPPELKDAEITCTWLGHLLGTRVCFARLESRFPLYEKYSIYRLAFLHFLSRVMMNVARYHSMPAISSSFIRQHDSRRLLIVD